MRRVVLASTFALPVMIDAEASEIQGEQESFLLALAGQGWTCYQEDVGASAVYSARTEAARAHQAPYLYRLNLSSEQVMSALRTYSPSLLPDWLIPSKMTFRVYPFGIGEISLGLIHDQLFDDAQRAIQEIVTEPQVDGFLREMIRLHVEPLVHKCPAVLTRQWLPGGRISTEITDQIYPIRNRFEIMWTHRLFIDDPWMDGQKPRLPQPDPDRISVGGRSEVHYWPSMTESLLEGEVDDTILEGFQDLLMLQQAQWAAFWIQNQIVRLFIKEILRVRRNATGRIIQGIRLEIETIQHSHRAAVATMVDQRERLNPRDYRAWCALDQAWRTQAQNESAAQKLEALQSIHDEMHTQILVGQGQALNQLAFVFTFVSLLALVPTIAWFFASPIGLRGLNLLIFTGWLCWVLVVATVTWFKVFRKRVGRA